MTVFPFSKDVSVNLLSQVFNKTTNSYKLLFFRAFLEKCNELDKPLEISFDELAIKALSYAAYSIKYYQISFGKSDQMTTWVNSISSLDFFRNTDLKPQNIEKKLISLSSSSEIKKYILEFSKYVPYRLITPFFGNELKGKEDYKKNSIILNLSNEENSPAIYSIKIKDDILLITPNEKWLVYLKENYSIVFGWMIENTIKYLQKNNPTVLSISSKLEPPKNRNMNAIKAEFEYLFSKKPDLKRCIYTNETLKTVSHDHFLPFTFFGTDPIYNFVPTSKNTNSSKNNSIPDYDMYFNKFSLFQWEFFKTLSEREKSKNSFMEILNDLKVDRNCDSSTFKEKLNDFYKPLYLSSKNQGFPQGWTLEATIQIT